MTLEEYLSKRCTSVADIIQGVTDRLGFADNDFLFFAGSLVEGLGNYRSDVDLYLFTNRDLSTHFDFTNTVILSVQGIVVDVEVFQWAYIEKLMENLTDFPPAEDRDFRKSLSITVGQLKLLHAMKVGKLARGDVKRCKYLNNIDGISLARILFDRSVAQIMSIKTDISGALECGDYNTARYLLSNYYWHIASIVLAVNGYTNPSEKWRVKNFEALKANTNKFAETVMGHKYIVDYFLNEKNTYSSSDGDPFNRFQCLTYISNILIPMGEFMFQAGHEPGSNVLAVNQLHGSGARTVNMEGAKACLPRLHHEVMIRYRNKGFMIAHGVKTTAQYINQIGFLFLVFFDGKTPYFDAISILEKNTGLNAIVIGQQLEHINQFLLEKSYV